MLRRHSPALAACLLVLAISLATACGDETTAPPPEAPNQRPVPTNLIPAQEIAVGETVTVDAAAYFSDPDGDALVFEAASSNANVVSVSLSGSSVAVVAQAPGEAQVTIRARDPGGLQARQTFNVLVPVLRTADHAVLQAFYEATGGEDWTNDDNWLTGRPLDTWYGVSVDEDGRVTDLDLDFNGLRGHLPPELGDLDRLHTLTLSRNELEGGIPAELRRLPILLLLNLRDNRFDGEIPPWLGDFSYLDQLDLSRNGLEGPIPAALGNLRALRLLDLSDNDLTGPMPPELGNLTALEVLLFMRNDLEGPVPETFERLVALRFLNLTGNAGLSGPLPASLTALFSLSELHLGGTALCAPTDRAFADWLERLRRHRVSPCGRDGAVLLTQAVQSARAFPCRSSPATRRFSACS